MNKMYLYKVVNFDYFDYNVLQMQLLLILLYQMGSK